MSGEDQYGLFLIDHGAGGEDLRDGIFDLKYAVDRDNLESVFEYGRYLLEEVGEEEDLEDGRLSRGAMYARSEVMLVLGFCMDSASRMVVVLIVIMRARLSTSV